MKVGLVQTGCLETQQATRIKIILKYVIFLKVSKILDQMFSDCIYVHVCLNFCS